MKFGLHIPDFTWECGVDTLRGDLADVARVAEQAGFDRISVWTIFGRSARSDLLSTRCSRHTQRSVTLPPRPSACSY